MISPQRGGIIFRLMFLLTLALFLVGIYLVRYPLLRLAGGWWVVDEQPAKADAILVLGDDNFAGDRAFKAVDLYRAGWAPVVVASGRLLRPYAGVAELIERDLQTHGVPPNAIVRFPQRAENTRAEAQALRDLVAARGWRRVLLVTSNYHTRRARYIFSKVFPSQITVITIAARDSDYDPDHWWETREGQKLFFMESAGYFEAMWESWRGSSSSGGSGSAPPAPANPSVR